MFVCSTFNDASLVVKGVLLIYLKWSPWQPGWKILIICAWFITNLLKSTAKNCFQSFMRAIHILLSFREVQGWEMISAMRSFDLLILLSIAFKVAGFILNSKDYNSNWLPHHTTTITSTSNALNFPVGGLLITLEHFTLKDNILTSFPKAESWYVWSPSAFKLKPYRLGKNQKIEIAGAENAKNNFEIQQSMSRFVLFCFRSIVFTKRYSYMSNTLLKSSPADFGKRFMLVLLRQK